MDLRAALCPKRCERKLLVFMTVYMMNKLNNNCHKVIIIIIEKHFNYYSESCQLTLLLRIRAAQRC